MFKNYFYIARAISELNSLLENEVISEIFSQEKDKLFISIGNDEYSDRHLIISCIPHLPYLLIGEKIHKARKNTVNFYSEFLPAQIHKFEIAENDRVIKISTTSCEFYFLIRGGQTNFIAFDGKSIFPFKKKGINLHELKNELTKLHFGTTANIPQIKERINGFEEISALRSENPVIPKELLAEMKLRFEFPIENFTAVLQNLITDILKNKIEIGTIDAGLHWFPSNWYKPDGFETKTVVESFLEGMKFFVSNYYSEKRKLQNKKLIRLFLQKELSHISNKLNKINARISAGSRESEYRKIADLLLSNLHKIKKGEKKILLTDLSIGEEIEINLKENLSPRENAEYYYEKARDESINFKKSLELLESAQNDFRKLKKIRERLDEANTPEELDKIKSELKLKTKNMKEKKAQPGFRYRRYVIEGKYDCYVGRDSKSNDYLSIKFAKQNDYWFHARGLSGSHVLLRIQNTKEAVPKSVIKKAASITAFFSKGKTASLVPVSYTFAKFVHKKKGMEPGKVMISKEKVILVKPEIPAGCEIYED